MIHVRQPVNAAWDAERPVINQVFQILGVTASRPSRAGRRRFQISISQALACRASSARQRATIKPGIPGKPGNCVRLPRTGLSIDSERQSSSRSLLTSPVSSNVANTVLPSSPMGESSSPSSPMMRCRSCQSNVPSRRISRCD
ncbi:L-alanine-DL-glutamate epimerase or related enzyme of enolase superfamily [Pseudomonas syringae pv. actinidiae]|uniref:L-alanine-DL-glutamate epimerase or related enzyme of enolase superfamily n=1 Tax=Pseudomonas syringae pv. actinidiae TaxID=103796 RepID=A0AAN4Q1N4_PSESF|nr:L-alanine-DL-glutamate epimerase or related enzyme of enolase superfamily [Pseudomonas syringae pv. actinidiae]